MPETAPAAGARADPAAAAKADAPRKPKLDDAGNPIPTPITRTAAEMTPKLRELTGDEEAEVGTRGPNTYIAHCLGQTFERALESEEAADGWMEEVATTAKKAKADAKAEAAKTAAVTKARA